MKPLELVQHYRDRLEIDSRAALLHFRLVTHFLAMHLYGAELNNAQPMTGADATDYKEWLHQLEEATAALLDGPPSGRAVSRYEDICNRCGHAHQGDAECGQEMGGGRICRCELEVPA